MPREPSKLLSRKREIELARGIEDAQRTLAETVAGSARALSALRSVVECAKLGPAEAAQHFLRLGDDWPDAERELDELLTAVRALQHRQAPGDQRARARETVVQALSRARLSRRAVDRLIGELQTRGAGNAAITKTISTLNASRQTYERAKATFVEANMGLVFSLANKRAHPGLSLHDLAQEGSMGLMRAVDRFDHRRGIRFSTYASWWIRHSINRALSDQARTIRIPVHMLDARYRVRRAAEQLSRRGGPAPTAAELAARTGVAVEKVELLAAVPAEPASLDAPLFEGGEGKLADAIADRSASSPLDAVAAVQAQIRLRRLLKTLTPREEEVIRLRFGIDRPEPLALEEIGRKFHISRERIRQIEAIALGKLYQRATSEKLDVLLTN